MGDVWVVVSIGGTSAYLQHAQLPWARSTFMSYDEAVALAEEANAKVRDAKGTRATEGPPADG